MHDLGRGKGSTIVLPHRTDVLGCNNHVTMSVPKSIWTHAECKACAGRYLATAGLDNQLVVWDVGTVEPEVVVKYDLTGLPTAGSWHPSSNELIIALANNQLMTWKHIIPAQKLPPHMPVSEVAIPGMQPSPALVCGHLLPVEKP
jgi:WD40 repeat protein